MPSNQQLIIAYGIPAAISLIVALVAWRPWSSASPRGFWAMPVAMGVGIAMAVVGHAHQYKTPSFPPASAEDWLFHAGWMLLLLGLLDALVPLWGEVRAVLVVLLAAALCYLLLGRVVQNPETWPAHRILTCLGGAAVAIALAATFIERSSEREPGWVVPAALLICAMALAPWPLFLGSADFTFRAAALPAVLLPLVAVAAWSKKLTVSRGGAMAFAVLYGALIVLTKGRLPDVAPWQAIVLAAAPVVALVPLWTPLRGWKRPVLSVAIAGAMVLTATIPPFIQWYKEQGSPEAYWGA
jgi:hypothetical protein